jgi:hypothetical protein
MPASTRIFFFSTLLCLFACTDVEPDVPSDPEMLTLPSTTPATGPRITGTDKTGLILSWMELGDESTSLRYSRFDSGAWSPANTVVTIDGMFINWADLPSVVAFGDGRLAAHWLQLSGDTPYAYDVAARISSDNGNSWSKIITPHRDGTDTEHGFVSMFDDESRLGVLWLDGRKYVNEVTDDPVASGMTLRAAVIDADLQLQNEQLVDNLICDCCQTDIATSGSGPIAVYRDRTIDEIRDIAVTRFLDGQWQAGQSIAADQWRISGCPVNGPAITAEQDDVAVAWFTGAGNQPAVKVAVSRDGGESFADPITVVDGSVLGHVDIAWLGDGRFAISWLQVSDGGIGEVMVRKVNADGDLGAVFAVSYGASSFSVPQMARSQDELVFVWTKSEDFVDQILSAKVPVAALNTRTH